MLEAKAPIRNVDDGSDGDPDDVAAGTDSSKLCSDMAAKLLSRGNQPAICS